MNFLFVGTQVFFFRHIESILESILRKGHTFQLLFADREKLDISDSAVREFLNAVNGPELEQLLGRKDKWAMVLNIIRYLVGYSIYLRPEHPSPLLRERFIKKIHPFARKVATNIVGQAALSSPLFVNLLRFLERQIPANPMIIEHLHQVKPDIVVAITNLIWDAPEVEYIKAAKALGLPTIVIVASWDNLTTKSTFHVVPDAVLVWNQALAQEAISLHDIPSHKIILTGAQVFDYLFDMQPSCDFVSFCKKVGLPADKAFVLYLGSSASIMRDETNYACQFAEAISQQGKVNILLRPHPINNRIWDNFAMPNVTIYPKGGALPDTLASKQEFFDALYHSTAVVGVNTSAMLEAAIVDKPCITIMTEKYNSSQRGLGHFQHLLRANFLEVASNFQETVDIIDHLLKNQDRLTVERRRFVRDFIRPHGLKNSSGEVCAFVAETILKKKPEDISMEIGIKFSS